MSTSVPSELASYARAQKQFAAHIRDPEHNPAPEGIEDRRMAIYRGLFYRNIEASCAGHSRCCIR